MQKRLRQKDISQRNKNDVAKTIFMNDKGGLKNGNDDDAEDFGCSRRIGYCGSRAADRSETRYRDGE